MKSTMTTVEAFRVKMAARVKTERRHIGKVNMKSVGAVVNKR